MQGKVKLFASLREAVGHPEITWELGEGATVETLVNHLRANVPGFSEALGGAWIAVNGRYVTLGTPLGDGDEVAFFPPVSGG